MLKMWSLFFCLCALFSPLLGMSQGIEEYFKLPTDFSGYHGMKNIDCIYIINLDQRPEKFDSCIKQLDPYGIKPYRFSAVNGWELPQESFAKLGYRFDPSTILVKDVKATSYTAENNWKPFHENSMSVPGKVYFSHHLSRGNIGIVLSHLSILQHALNQGFKTIWIMEDDIDIIQNPHKLSDLIEKLDALLVKKRESWDVLFTDRDTKNQRGQYVPCTTYAQKPNFIPENPNRFAERRSISPDFRTIGARYGAYSMILRESGMKKILDFIKTYKIFLPYDMEFFLPNDIHLYTVNNDIVSTQIKAPSDNGAANYLKKK